MGWSLCAIGVGVNLIKEGVCDFVCGENDESKEEVGKNEENAGERPPESEKGKIEKKEEGRKNEENAGERPLESEKGKIEKKEEDKKKELKEKRERVDNALKSFTMTTVGMGSAILMYRWIKIDNPLIGEE